MDQERDDANDLFIGSSIQTSMSPIPIGQQSRLKLSSYGSFLENDQSQLYEGMMSSNNDSMNSQLGSKAPQFTLMGSGLGSDPNLFAGKRPLQNLYWNEEGNGNSSPPTKRFLAESCDGSICRTDETANSVATILSQLPAQTPSLQQQAMLGTLGDGVFRQQPYQVSGMNWYA